MDSLNKAEQELVALGAALGSNCVPCIEYHIPQARAAGLTDLQIGDAVRLADKIRQVPARKVLAAAIGLLRESGAAADAAKSGAGCGQEPSTSAPAGSPCCG